MRSRLKKAAVKIIRRFGIRQPLVVGVDNTVVVGAITLLAARHFGLESVPVIRAEDLGPVELKALSVAYSRLGELGGWHQQRLGSLMLRFEAETADKVEVPTNIQKRLGSVN